MIYTWIICGGLGLIAGWFFGRSRRYKKKWKDLEVKYKDTCQKASEAFKILGDLTIRNGDLESELRECKRLFTSDFGLRIDEMYELENGTESTSVCIVAYNKEHPEVTILVKRFSFDNDDLDDYDFARREAEELIETINKF